MHSFCTEINNVQNKTTNNLIPEKPVHLVCGQRYYCEVEQKTVCVCVCVYQKVTSTPHHLFHSTSLYFTLVSTWWHVAEYVLDHAPCRVSQHSLQFVYLFYCLLYILCVYPGEPVVWTGGFHSQYGNLWLSSGRQAGQQQEHSET